jgi:hypothetical protein
LATQRPAEGHERGLPSLNQARAERRRALARGGLRSRGISPHFWIWVAVLLAGFAVVYWKIQQGQLESQKSAVMAKQRAIAKTLGVRLLPFRDRIERWVIGLGGAWNGDYVAPGVSFDRVAQEPGVYLRLRAADARDAKSMRTAAVRSLHDGFTACFFRRRPGPDPSVGPKCRLPSDCKPGFLCNEYNVCHRPTQPYNMRLAYRALKVLSPEWTDELHQASSDLAVQVYDEDLDRVTHTDVPIAIAVMTRAKYFTAVLDEDPKTGLPKPLSDAGESDEQRVQRVAHDARVGIWDLTSGKQILRLRAEAAGRFVPVGEGPAQTPDTLASEQRQVNSCALALDVRDALEKNQEPAGDAGP